MKRFMFNIIKLLISIAFQCSIFIGSWVPLAAYFHEDEIPYWYWMLFILAFLLGEWGIFLLYKLKPIEKIVPRIIYAIIYMGIHVTSIVAFCGLFGYIFILSVFEVFLLL